MVLFLSLFFFILPFYTQNFKHSIVCFMMPFIVLAASAVPMYRILRLLIHSQCNFKLFPDEPNLQY